MKFMLFVEGYTEQKAIPTFLKRWLDKRLTFKVGIQSVRFDGWAEMVKDLPQKASLYLNDRFSQDVIAVIGLLDAYGPTFYPNNKKTVMERVVWAKKELESRVNNKRFRMFFAVHEVEAWLLSDPSIFPPIINSSLPDKVQYPEMINFNKPPAQLLDKIYKERTGHSYKKITQGNILFNHLDPDMAYNKCPFFKELLDEMYQLAKQSGL